eukprot:Skav217039  [mRNA]  locus=scaffold3292:28403:29146:+ [translate_table: standard]
MADCHGPDYEFFQLFCEPSDVGHAACARHRTYVIGAHQELTQVLHDPWELQEVIKRQVAKHAFTHPSDYLIATTTEVQLEAEEKARARGVLFQPGQTDLSYILNEREQNALTDYETAYFQRFGFTAANDEDLFVFLGDDPAYSLTWSIYGRLPTYRMNSRHSILWSCKHKRWVTGKERLASLGWPVHPNLASAMECPQTPALDVKRSADLAGNSMHLLNCGVVQAIALSAFGPSRTTTPDFVMEEEQ